jgi:hypothetical protein
MNYTKCLLKKKKILVTDLFVNLINHDIDMKHLITLLREEGFNLSTTLIIYSNELMNYKFQQNNNLFKTINSFSSKDNHSSLVFYNSWPQQQQPSSYLLIVNSLTINQYINLIMNNSTSVVVKFFNPPLQYSLYEKDYTMYENQIVIQSHDLFTIPKSPVPNLVNILQSSIYDPANTIFIFKYTNVENIFDEFRIFYTTMSQLHFYHWSLAIEPIQFIQLNLFINYEYSNFEWLTLLNKINKSQWNYYINLWFDKTLFSLANSFIQMDELQQYNSQICFQNEYAPIANKICKIHRQDEPLAILGGFPWNNDSMSTLNVQMLRYGPWIFENRFNLLPSTVSVSHQT